MSSNERHVSDVDIEAMKLLDDLKRIKTSKMEDKSTKPFKRQIVWKNVFVFSVGHILAVYGLYLGLFHTSLQQAFCFMIFAYYCSVQGVQVGAHRFYSHRCFKASKAMRVAMILAQTAASQNCMWVWVRDHRQHHKYSDTDGDPHNAKNGFFFCHVGWLLSKKHPDVMEKGKTIDMSDLDADRLVMFQKNHYKKLWVMFALVLPALFPVIVFGEPVWKSFLIWDALRIVVSLNATWLVNSWAHLYGTRPYDKNIMPVESYFVSFVGLGEGWHNYHHTFPWDYKASDYGVPYNFAATYIDFWARLGAVWDLKEAPQDMVSGRALRTGDGTLRTQVHIGPRLTSLSYYVSELGAAICGVRMMAAFYPSGDQSLI